MSIRTIAYIDGYNLYYGGLKDSQYKWLDVEQLIKRYAKQNDVLGIKYFSAPVVSRRHDPSQHIRQQIYWRALRTICNLEIIEGHFLSRPRPMLEVDNRGELTGKYVNVLHTQEKGSDVNLASELLLGAFKNEYDLAVVLSNDSDLLMPIKIIRKEFSKKVMVLNAHKKNPSSILSKNSDFFYSLTVRDYAESQFSETLTDLIGRFKKPDSW